MSNSKRSKETCELSAGATEDDAVVSLARSCASLETFPTRLELGDGLTGTLTPHCILHTPLKISFELAPFQANEYGISEMNLVSSCCHGALLMDELRSAHFCKQCSAKLGRFSKTYLNYELGFGDSPAFFTTEEPLRTALRFEVPFQVELFSELLENKLLSLLEQLRSMSREQQTLSGIMSAFSSYCNSYGVRDLFNE